MECEKLQYVTLPYWTNAEIRWIIEHGDLCDLWRVPLVASLYPTSRVHAEQICLRFASHPHVNVRGNAMEGFGHIARIFRSLNKRLIEPVMEAGLSDPDDWVRDKAEYSVDEIERFCGWVFRGREDRRTQPVCSCRSDVGLG